MKDIHRFSEDEQQTINQSQYLMIDRAITQPNAKSRRLLKLIKGQQCYGKPGPRWLENVLESWPPGKRLTDVEVTLLLNLALAEQDLLHQAEKLIESTGLYEKQPGGGYLKKQSPPTA